MQSEFRQDIQVLRGLFVISVVLFHFFPSWVPSGYLGVDGFFIVSGYVLAPQLLNIFSSQQPVLNYIKFVKRRFWRLYPAFLVTIGISLVFLFFFISPNSHKRSLSQILYSLVNLGDIGAFKFSGNYFDPSQNPFVHLWSLSVEWQFYIFFPLITILVLTLTGKFTRLNFAGFLLILTFLSLTVWTLQNSLEQLIVTLGFTNYSLGLGYYIGVGRFWQFLVGFVAFALTQRFKDILTKQLKSILIVILIILLLWRSPHEIFSSIFVSLATALLLVDSSNGSRISGHFRTEEFFLFLGKISYSVYLVHFPLLIAYNENLPFFDLNLIEDTVARILLCTVIIFVSSIVYKYVENRYRVTISSPDSVFTHKTYSPIIFFGLTLGVFTLGMSSSYFGLAGNIQKPPYQTYIGQNCLGNSQNAIPCVGNVDGKKGTVILLGDSHAEHFSKTFFESAKSLDLKYYGIGFCAPSLKPYAEQREGCLRFSLKAKSEIERIRPEVLVVSVLISKNDMLRSVLSYISEIQKSVGRVIVIGNSPYFQEPLFVSNPIVYGTQNSSKGSYEKDMNLEFRSLSTNFVTEVRDLGIKVIDLWPLFCDKSYCSRFDKGNWLFVDQHHFSSDGAARLEPIFLEHLGIQVYSEAP